MIRLHHHDAGGETGAPYLALELVKGESLGDLCNTWGPLPPPVVMFIGRVLGRVLVAMHELGLVHRDLKPAHVMIDRDHPDRLVLRGFLFVLGPEAEAGPPLNPAVLGTPGHMAPEQARGDPVDGRADVFALGVLLYQLLTGALPFVEPTLAEYLTALERQNYVPPEVLDERLPRCLAEVIEGCLRCDPDARWHALEVVRTLERGLREELLADADVEPGHRLLDDARAGKATIS